MTNSPDSTSLPGPPLEEADLPGFEPRRADRLDPPQPSTTTSSSTSTSTDPPASSWETPAGDVDEDLDDGEYFEPTLPRSATSSSRGSTEPDPAVAAAFGQLATLAATFGSLLVERSVGKGTGAWVATEAEAAAIGTPLGRIAARHAPIGADTAGDVADGIEAGYATVAYGMRAATDHARGGPPPEAPRPPGPEPML